jgi:hypothetical protein
MINRRKLKEVLETAAHKAGGVRALARNSGINPTSLQDYIDEKTIPGSEMISRIAAYCLKSPAYFFDESTSYANPQPTDESVTPAHGLRKTYALATPNKKDKYKVIAEVGEILDSGNEDIISALVKNVQEFKRAVETSKRLNVCENELDKVQGEVADLRRQVDHLSSPSTGADQQAASSGKGKT